MPPFFINMDFLMSKLKIFKKFQKTKCSNISNDKSKSVTNSFNNKIGINKMVKVFDNDRLREQFVKADPSVMVTTEEVAAYTGLSVSWFNTKAVEGDGIRYRKIGKRRMYMKQDVLDWLEKHCPKVSNTMQYDS